MWLVRLAIANPHMVTAFMIMLVVTGLLSSNRIPVDILPVFESPAVQVMTYYPGMPASAIEKTITNRIERWVNQAPGARLVESRSVPGVSLVKVYFREDIDPNVALTLTNSLALGALPNLPPNTLPPVALPFDATGTLPVGILTVQNKNLDDSIQKDVARVTVRNMLGAVPGTIAPVVVGGKDRSIMIYLDPVKMDARGLAPMDIVQALKKGNLMVSPGTAYFGEQQLLLDNNAMVSKVEELNALPVSFGVMPPVLVKDIGHAEDAAAIQTSSVRIAGASEVYLPIYRQSGASSLAVVDGVKARIKAMQERLPEGTLLNLVMDQTTAVRSALHAMVMEGVVGALLVSLMILFFLSNVKMTVIASTSIPLAMLTAVTGLYLTGNTINTMTLSGLALAIGPLVDEAIVELENNHRNHRMGKSRIEAALEACREVLLPVIVSTLTTFIVLAPMAFMEGMGGFLFKPLALAVGFAMLASFFLSRTYIPMMCVTFLPWNPPCLHKVTSLWARFSERPLQWFTQIIDRQHILYQRALSACLAHKAPVLGFVLALFLVSLSVIPLIGKEFFPMVDSGQITLHVRCPSNLRLSAAEKRIAAVEDAIKALIPESARGMIVSEIGLTPDWSSAYTANAGQQDATIRIQLNEDRTSSSLEIAQDLRHQLTAMDRFSDLRFDFDTGGMITSALNMGSTAPINLQLEGGKAEEASAFAVKLKNLVSRVQGVADVRVVQRSDAPYLVFEVDRIKAAEMGISAQDVVTQAVVALNSSVSVDKNFWIDTQSGNQYFIGVQYPEDLDRLLPDILTLPVKGSSPTVVNLGTLVHARRSLGAVEIHHSDLQRVINISVNLEGRDLSAVAGDLTKMIEQLDPPPGLRVSLKGQYERMNESFATLASGMGLATLIVYLIQVMLFRSWLGPLVIMTSVPMGFIGVIWILLLTGTTLNLQSIIGTVFLVGISVNNGVLMVDYANRLKREGLSSIDAIRQAAAVRFRPIIMTFLATILALLPMAIGVGHGHEASIPLARAVVGGLLSSTTLTLFVVPILYTYFIKSPTEGSHFSQSQ